LFFLIKKVGELPGKLRTEQRAGAAGNCCLHLFIVGCGLNQLLVLGSGLNKRKAIMATF
jgi:hypothetical protein